MAYQFPRTEVAGVSLPRMIIGTNWVAGWSHRSPAADALITERHASTEKFAEMLHIFLDNGINAIMAPFGLEGMQRFLKVIYDIEEKRGEKIILIDTPFVDIDNTPAARASAEASIKKSKSVGATFCLLHHSCVERLVNKATKKIERIDDYTKMIRDAGLIPGLSAHMPEIVVYSDLNGYDVETYIQIYNCLGFLMQVEIETVNRIIHQAKKPVMTIKSMAAGRCTPFVGLNFSWATLRDCDMVTVGCTDPREVLEDIEISRAAFEKRAVNLGVRSSPNMNQDAFGKKK
ncbi:MAG: hypothetical protein WDA00_03210 [Eubacteriales bacterium]